MNKKYIIWSVEDQKFISWPSTEGLTVCIYNARMFRDKDEAENFIYTNLKRGHYITLSIETGNL